MWLLPPAKPEEASSFLSESMGRVIVAVVVVVMVSDVGRGGVEATDELK